MSNSQSFWNHPIEKIEEALHIKKQIAALEAKLDKLMGGTATEPTRSVQGKTKAKVKSKRSASASSASSPSPKAIAKKKKGGMSAEAKAKISAAQKARWAAKRKAEL